MTHGLQVNGTFTWSKAIRQSRQDIFNPDGSKSIQPTDQPFLFNANIVYQTQKAFRQQDADLGHQGLAVRRVPAVRQRSAR